MTDKLAKYSSTIKIYIKIGRAKIIIKPNIIRSAVQNISNNQTFTAQEEHKARYRLLIKTWIKLHFHHNRKDMISNSTTSSHSNHRTCSNQDLHHFWLKHLLRHIDSMFLNKAISIISINNKDKLLSTKNTIHSEVHTWEIE